MSGHAAGGGTTVLFPLCSASSISWCSSRDVRDFPIEERKGALEEMITRCKAKGVSGSLLYVRGVLDQAEWLYSQILSLELEGIVCKRVGSTYQDGARSSDWLKVKRPGAVPAQRFTR
jgi:bifunctional non-homologous end joining protein LigD